jgi:hypothetical protein
MGATARPEDGEFAMWIGKSSKFARRSYAAAFGFVAGLALVGASSPAQAQQKEITVIIKTVKAIDKLDVFSKADFYAKVTIAGETFSTPVVKQADQITPNWRVSKRVAAGRHDVKLEILDKDLTKSEPIDINRLDNKRNLDFVVSTRNCRIEGFASTYRCGADITRAGNETKKAEVTFTVEVR